MNSFNPSPKTLVVNELIEKGYIPDHDDALRLCHELEEQEQTDGKFAIGLTAVGIIGAGVTFAFCGAVAPLLVPITAIGVGALGVWNHPIVAKRRDNEADFLRANPTITALIEAKLENKEAPFKIASAYTECFRAWRNTGQPLAGHSVTPSVETNEVALIESPAICDSKPCESSNFFNPALDLGQNPQSALIVGTPGSGKGMLVSNAIRVLRQKTPALKVMMIDPKGDPKETGYWAPVTDVYRSMNLMNCDDPDQGTSWLLSCMDEFRQMDAPKLLIFDEMLAASTEISLAHKDFKAPQRFKKFVSGIIAQGDSQSVWVWAMSQSVQVADLGFGGGVRGNLRAIAIISPKNTTAIEALTSTRLIPPPNGGMDELRDIMAVSPVNRAFYDGKVSRWLPMPRLENHSGFDRDNRKIDGIAPNPQRTIVDQLNHAFDSESAKGLDAVENTIEVVSSLGSIRLAFSNWNPKSQELASKIVDWMAERTDKSHLPSEVKKSIRLLKDDPTLTTERVRSLLDQLTEKQFLTSSDGRYSIKPQTETYNF
jgi:hypothetical protein